MTLLLVLLSYNYLDMSVLFVCDSYKEGTASSEVGHAAPATGCLP